MKNRLNNNGRPWSELEDQRLMAMLDEGRSPRSIGLTLRRTANAVVARTYILRTKVRRAGLSEQPASGDGDV
jgi:hypothetical protein